MSSLRLLCLLCICSIGARGTSAAANTALVLQGGGAKGAWQVGAIKALCADPRTPKWDMLSGTGSGALNGGILAQFAKDEQCTKGVAALEAYWDTIKTPNDVYRTPGHSFDPKETCFDITPESLRAKLDTLTALPKELTAFFLEGGLCDPQSGADNFKAWVKQDRIAASGMRLRVAASSLKHGRVVWFDEHDRNVVDGMLASSSFSPLVYPHVIENEFYVDGGLFHITPLQKALSTGAQRAVVILVNPLKTKTLDLSSARNKDNKGFAIFGYNWDIAMSQTFQDRELEDACAGFPDADILGVVPAVDVGGMTDFQSDKIKAMSDAGHDFVVANGTVDLCKAAGHPRGPSLQEAGGVGEDGLPNVLVFFVGLLVGVTITALVAMPFLRRARVLSTSSSGKLVSGCD